MEVTFNRFTYKTLIASLFVMFSFCNSPQHAGGVETTNGITITVKQNQIIGTAPAGSRIVLCDTLYATYMSFEPFTKLYIDTIFTDETGKFAFDSLSEGFYNLSARNFNADSGTIITNISINRLLSKETHKSSEFTKLGSISGRVFIDTASVSLAMVSVMGTELRDTADGQGKYTIEKVPQGIHKITGSFYRIFRPDSTEYYLTTVNITVPENVQATEVNLNLEKIKW